MNKDLLSNVSIENLRRDLFYFCRDPFTFRTVSYTAPWHEKNSLDEIDDFIFDELKKYAEDVKKYPNKIRAFRCNSNKPLHHWYDTPKPEDPWYDANSIQVTLPGSEKPDEIIQLISHKDSMSWINSPGAHDNAVGAVANLELVRVLSKLPHKKTIRVLFCNEEHNPWHSLKMAEMAKSAGDNIIAIMNQDSLCGKTDEAAAAGIKTMVACYSTPQGKALAEFVVKENEKYAIPMCVTIGDKPDVNDDDGSYIKAGYVNTINNIGSWPYADPQYHLRGDIPERVDMFNLLYSTQLILAAIMDIDEMGSAAFLG